MASFDVTAAWVTLLSLTFILLTISLIAFIYHKKQTGCDSPNWASLALFTISTIDFLTDILFFTELSMQNHELSIYYAIFFFIPHILSNIFCIIFIIRSKYYAKPKPLNVDWITQNDKYLILLTFFGNFYSTIEIQNTKLFHLNILNMQITNRNRNQLHLIHVINDILMGSFPLMIIQMAYMSMNQYEDITIAIIAMLFSFTSIAIAIFFIVSRLCNNLVDLIIPMNDGDDNDAENKPKDKASTIYRLMTLKSEKLRNNNLYSHSLISNAWSSSLQISEYQIKTIFIEQIFTSNLASFIGIKCKIKIKPEISDENLFLLLKLLENDDSGAYDILKQDINIKLNLNDSNLELFVERATLNSGMNAVKNVIDFSFGDVVKTEIGNETWKCPACTFENHYLINQCEVCQSAKPGNYDDSNVYSDNNVLIQQNDEIIQQNLYKDKSLENNEQNNDENKEDENEEEEMLDDRKFSMIMNKGNKGFGMDIQEEKELFQEIENDNKQMLQNEDERDGGFFTGDLMDSMNKNDEIEKKDMEEIEYEVSIDINDDDDDEKIMDIIAENITDNGVNIIDVIEKNDDDIINDNDVKESMHNNDNSGSSINAFEISEIHNDDDDEHDIIMVPQSVPESIPKSIISVQQFNDEQENDMKQAEIEIDLFDNNYTNDGNDGLSDDFDGLNNDFDNLLSNDVFD